MVSWVLGVCRSQESAGRFSGRSRLARWVGATLLALSAALQADDIAVYQPELCSTDESFRFIFIVDNSGSMSTAEFDQSKATVDATILHVLDNLTDVEVAVVQYGSLWSSYVANIKHTYDVSVPFTTDKAVATNWHREFYSPTGKYPAYTEDHQPASLSKMRLDNVYGPGGALDITDATNVQFVFFTDALRDVPNACCSSLVAESSTYIKSTVYPLFGEYDALKNGSVLPGGLEAQFTIFHVSNNANDKRAAAAIASVGGTYAGQVENNPFDPDGSGTLPRRYVTGSFAASDTDTILNLIDQVLVELQYPSESESFSGLSVDLARGEWHHDDRAFVSVFKPSLTRSWSGNVKGFFVGDGGLVDTTGAAATTLDTSGVRFTDSAQSFWSAVADGDVAVAGGAQEQVQAREQAGTRLLMTDIQPALALTAPENSLGSANAALTASMLGVSTTTERDAVLGWLASSDMGAPLHTSPVTVRYAGRDVIYAATNRGLLHAIDATAPTAINDHSGGDELWAWMPQELLSRVVEHKLYGNDTGEHLYGLDGAITPWHVDSNGDGIVDSGETMLLVIGMRRGGNNYYAIDVSDPMAPSLAWKILGGVTTGFSDLAQSWSRPSLVRVKRSGVSATAVSEAGTDRVLVFSGGYDAATLDDRDKRQSAAGGAIYMVDRDGRLLWKTDASMSYSMPADPSVIDSDGDGLADRLYAADLGGRIWRVDFDDVADTASFSVALFADLGSGQPFFYAPSVALTTSLQERYLSIAIGSGDRDRPLEPSASNRLYTLKDRHVGKGALPSGFVAISESDLVDVTAYQLGSADTTTRQAAAQALIDGSGWVIRLATGEKVLSQGMHLEGYFLATTSRPLPMANTDSCQGLPEIENRLYVVEGLSGSPSNRLDATLGSSKPEERTHEDRYEILELRGLPPSPMVLFPPAGDDPTIMVDRLAIMDMSQALERIFWYPYE